MRWGEKRGKIPKSPPQQGPRQQARKGFPFQHQRRTVRGNGWLERPPSLPPQKREEGERGRGLRKILLMTIQSPQSGKCWRELNGGAALGASPAQLRARANTQQQQPGKGSPWRIVGLVLLDCILPFYAFVVPPPSRPLLLLLLPAYVCAKGEGILLASSGGLCRTWREEPAGVGSVMPSWSSRPFWPRWANRLAGDGGCFAYSYVPFGPGGGGGVKE